MNDKVESRFNAAMKLSDDERVELANRIYLSVDAHADFVPSPEEAAEIERRVDEVRQGRAKPIPSDEAFAEVMRRIQTRK